jgi:hypothetical protein
MGDTNKSERSKVCAGRNCSSTDDRSHSKECIDDHFATVHRSPQDLRIYTALYTHPAVSDVPDDWIKCSDRMPDVRCLAFTPSDHEEIRYRIVPERILKALSDATHWMPLPAPPKQEQGE